MIAGLATLLTAGLAVGWLFLVLHTAWLLTHPPRRSYAWALARSLPGDPGELQITATDDSRPAIRGLSFTAASVRTPDGIDLAAWNVQGGNSAGPFMIVSPGWGDSRVVMLSRLAALWPLASHLILYDSRGHGDSGGRCTLGTREVPDLLAVIARTRELAPNSPIVLFGFSLGAGVSIAAAALDGRIDAVIAEAPYRFPITPARNVLRARSLPYQTTLAPAMALLGLIFGQGPRWMTARPGSTYDRAAHARHLPASTRLLILHGTDDAICPIDDARAIAAAHAGSQLVELPQGDHTTLFMSPATADACASALRAFMEHAASTSVSIR